MTKDWPFIRYQGSQRIVEHFKNDRDKQTTGEKRLTQILSPAKNIIQVER